MTSYSLIISISKVAYDDDHTEVFANHPVDFAAHSESFAWHPEVIAGHRGFVAEHSEVIAERSELVANHPVGFAAPLGVIASQLGFFARGMAVVSVQS